MLRKTSIRILSLAKWVVLAGVILLSLAVYNYFSTANHDANTIPTESELTHAEGVIVAGREITVEHKHAQQSSQKTEQYYELDLKPTKGTTVLLRLDHSLDKNRLAQVLESQVSVAYDASRDNMTYVVRKGESEVVSYAEMVQLYWQHTPPQASHMDSPYILLVAGLLLLMLGITGIWLHRNQTHATSDSSSPRESDEAIASQIRSAQEHADGSLISLQGHSLLIDTQIASTYNY